MERYKTAEKVIASIFPNLMKIINPWVQENTPRPSIINLVEKKRQKTKSYK